MKPNMYLLACAILLSMTGTAIAQPEAPALLVFTTGSRADLSWNEVKGATGYLLNYAPLPYTGSASIVSLDMGNRKSLSTVLPPGTSYYIAVQSKDSSGYSQYSNIESVSIGSYPIAADVFTTQEKTVSPVALSLITPQISPADISLYDVFGYSAWQDGPGLSVVKRLDIMPAGYTGTSVSNVGRLMNFFAITDIHITDKESPAQVIYSGLTAPFGAGGLSFGAYSPIISYTTQVLDAAIQTINAIHARTPFDFGISLGDDINNTQYNELRWFIDVLDGKEINPSSGDHIGSNSVDFQKPYKAAGLNKAIPWYQVVGNHDQYFTGLFRESDFIRSLHVGDTINNMGLNFDPPGPNNQGFYMGVVDGSTPDGVIRGAGPVAFFKTPPKVVADPDRHSLSTISVSGNTITGSSTLNWMKEFFNTTSLPVGHGFTQANLDQDFASYTFEPKSNLPIRVIALDDTCKANINAQYPYDGQGCIDQVRYDWLVQQLDKGQAEGKLMIIAAHIPIAPQTSLTNPTPSSMFYVPPASTTDPHAYKTEDQLLATLHNYPNLILWIAGHRHLNTITAQPSPDPSRPELGFWEVETASLRDFPQQFRSFEIVRNSDNTLSIIAVDVDPAVRNGSLAERSRSYAVGVARIGGGLTSFTDTSSHSTNAELVKQLGSMLNRVGN